MTDIKKKKIKGIESRKKRYGWMFISPWILGFVLFFLIPIVQSVMFAFSYVELDIGGFLLEFAGFEHFKYLWNEDTTFVSNLSKALGDILYSLPLIVALSLTFAVILNQKFKGRLLARAIFFLPVIIASGVIMEIMSSATSGGMSAVGGSNGYSQGMIDFDTLLGTLNLPVKVTQTLSMYLGNIFNLVWDCGVQTVLFISGLQSVPAALYEVSKVEGATKWEDFWYITFPMLGNTTLLVIIYTIIELVVKSSNPVIKQAYNLMLTNQVYDESSAILWFYFIIVGALAGLFIAIYNRVLLRRWQ